MTRWLLVLCLSALFAPVAHGQSLAKVRHRKPGSRLRRYSRSMFCSSKRSNANSLLDRGPARSRRKARLSRAKGFQDVEAGKEMTTDALFRIASMSKPVTSVAVMILVDDGRLKVTDPVSKYLPEFKIRRC